MINYDESGERNMNKVPVLINPSTITEVGDECVVMPKKVSEDCMVGLANETAAFIIHQINGVNSIDNIADTLCNTYEVDKITAVNIINDFITLLQENGVCKWKKEN